MKVYLKTKNFDTNKQDHPTPTPTNKWEQNRTEQKQFWDKGDKNYVNTKTNLKM